MIDISLMVVTLDEEATLIANVVCLNNQDLRQFGPHNPNSHAASPATVRRHAGLYHTYHAACAVLLHHRRHHGRRGDAIGQMDTLWKRVVRLWKTR
jgi:hypothetical protein